MAVQDSSCEAPQPCPACEAVAPSFPAYADVPPTTLVHALLATIALLVLLLIVTYRKLWRIQKQLHCPDDARAPRRSDASTQFPATDDTVDAALADLRQLLRANDCGDADFNDSDLRCHLEAAHLDPATARIRVLATERWREERAGAPPQPTRTALALVPARSPRRVAIVGTDARGRPCLRVRLCEPLDTFPEEVLGVLEECLAPPAPPSTQLVVLLDLRHYTPAALYKPPLGVGFELVRTLRAHYPQRCAAVHVLHLPPLGRWLVSVACNVLDSRTARKVAVYDAEGAALAAALAPHFEPSQLPGEYGGTDAAPFLPGEEAGPAFLDGAMGRGLATSASAPSSMSALAGEASAAGEAPRGRGDAVQPPLNGHHGHCATGGPSQGAPPIAPPPILKPAGPPPRYVWSALSEAEAGHVQRLRELAAADKELQRYTPGGLDAATMDDDELVRFLIDCTPPFNMQEALGALRNAAKARAKHITFPLPLAPEDLDAWSHVVRFDGVTRDGEPAFFVVISRAFQDALLDDPGPFLKALVGLMHQTRLNFKRGEMETVQTVVQVERGFRLNLKAIAAFTGATHAVMGALVEMYPSLTSRILVVNLPPSLVWFVKFIKGFLCEASQRKIEVINTLDELRPFYADEQMPSYYRERGSIEA